MNLKFQPEQEKNAVQPHKDKVLTFFDQSSSNGMTRFYGVVCSQKKARKVAKTEIAVDQKNENE